jgi:hypothetical protein
MLLTEGGLKSNKEWQGMPFLPYNQLRRKWQYYLLTEIKRLLPKTKENARLIDRLFKDNKQGFYVHGKSKMTSARHAARYIGRYMARPALAEYRISRYDGQKVTFWYKSHETEQKEYETLNAIDFIQRLIDHIPVKGFKMVRHYGLYSRRSKRIALEILKGCRKFIQCSLEFVSGLSDPISWRQRLIKSFGKDPLICPYCLQEMELWYIWHPSYGTIYDMCSEQLSVGDEKESKTKNEDKRFMDGSQRKHQLYLFPV